MDQIPSKRFSKSDYLTPKQVAKEINEDEELVMRAMKIAYLNRAVIMIKVSSTTAARPLVIRPKYSHLGADASRYRLRSDGIDEFKKVIEKIKQKGR